MSAPVCKLPPNSLTSFDLDCPCAKCSATRTYLHDKHLGTPTASAPVTKDRARDLWMSLAHGDPLGSIERVIADAEESGRVAERAACLEIVDKGFWHNWVVEDITDAIKARSKP